MKPEEQIMTFDRAMNLSRHEATELFRRHINHPLASLLKLGNVDMRFTKAEGIYLYDEEGQRYMDLTAGYGALNLGHNPKEVIKAVNEAQKLPAVLLVGHNPLMGALGKTLASILPGDLSVAIFGSGGAEAIENAMKTARASTGREKFVSCVGGYHGLSFGALSVCGSERFRMTVAPLLEHCELIPFGELKALEQTLQGKEVAAFIVEPVQGEGGAVVPPKGYLKGAADLCRKFGTLLIFDEIQTGFGRTGKMFAMEHDDVIPDIVTLSKSLGSGVVPISVSVTSEEIWMKAFGSRDRFDLIISTFAGNPAACAAALKTIEIMQRDDIPDHARALGDYARNKLQNLKTKHKLVKKIRGNGLLLGIELETAGLFSGTMEHNLSIMVMGELLHKHNILTSYYDFDPKVIRFEPPLIVTTEQIDEAVDALDKVLSRGKQAIALSFGKTAIGSMLRH
ncbi:MAG: aspartate aminotransferase family protein [Thermodesulfovibrionales bacterium]|jgi:putrescine aminotransferase|nr:aspartate aminotransferase family protein [Thermodesulfovibrionales bacterium]